MPASPPLSRGAFLRPLTGPPSRRNSRRDFYIIFTKKQIYIDFIFTITQYDIANGETGSSQRQQAECQAQPQRQPAGQDSRAPNDAEPYTGDAGQ